MHCSKEFNKKHLTEAKLVHDYQLQDSSIKYVLLLHIIWFLIMSTSLSFSLSLIYPKDLFLVFLQDF